MSVFNKIQNIARVFDGFVCNTFAGALQHPFIVPLLWLLPVALYAAALTLFNVNMPEGDDIHALAEFMLRYDAAQGLDKLTVVLAPHNEHFILFQHIATVLNLEMAGAVDFNTLKWIGAAGLAGAVWLLWAGAGRMRNKFLLLAAVPLFALNAKQWVNIVSAICALTWHWNLFLGFGALYLLTRAVKSNSRQLTAMIAAAALAVLCTLSLLGGIGALLVGAGYLALRRNWLGAGAWLGLAVGVVAIIKFSGQGSVPLSQMIADGLAAPLSLLLFYANLCGGILRIGAQPVTSTIFGVVLIAAAVRLIVFGAPAAEGEERGDAPLRLFAAYLLLLCASIALGRLGWGLKQAFESRYMLLSGVLAATVVAAYAPRMEQVSRRFLPYVLLLALALNVGSYIDAHHKLRTRLDGMTTARALLLDSLQQTNATAPASGLDPVVVELARKGLFLP